MFNFKKYKLGELSSDISYGYTESAKQEKVGPKFLRITDIQTDHINWDSVPYCPIKKNDFKKYKLEIGDIVVARTGNSTGATSVIKENIEAVFASYLIRFRLDKKVANPFFVDFVLRSNNWKNFIESIKGGSAQPGANAKQLSEFEFLLPDLPIQSRIASILSSLDDKIELNRRMNQTLEQMAQALFNHYFVDNIDPNNLPEGWKVGKVGELLELKYGKALKENERKIGNYAVVGSGGIIGYNDEFICEEKGIVVGRKGNSGAVSWLHEAFYPIDTTFYVSDLLGIKDLYYYYFLLKSLNLKNLNSDSAVPGLNRNEAHNQEIVIPKNKKIIGFNESVSSFFDRININLKETKTLTTIRDTLLPKLMSGEIDVYALMK
jgi:type I restriction enzyme S subunit